MEPGTRGRIVDPAEVKALNLSFFELPLWAFCHDVEREVRSYSTSDLDREYFIPDLQ